VDLYALYQRDPGFITRFKGVKEINMDELKESGYVESSNWDKYYDSLMELANAALTGESIKVTITSEFAVQRNAVEYAS